MQTCYNLIYILTLPNSKIIRKIDKIRQARRCIQSYSYELHEGDRHHINPVLNWSLVYGLYWPDLLPKSALHQLQFSPMCII